MKSYNLNKILELVDLDAKKSAHAHMTNDSPQTIRHLRP